MPQAPLPALWTSQLTKFFRPFASLWETGARSADTRANARSYLLGLLLPGERKSMEPIADRLPQTTVDRIQQFLTDSPWPSDLLQTRLIEVMAQRFATAQGVLSLDDTSFPKQGRASVGVARQWCGSIGKSANCQVGVSLYYVLPRPSHHADLIGFSCGMRLYLPQGWSEASTRRERARVPPEIEFEEKWRIGLALIDRARRLHVSHRAVLADADYGRSLEFRQALRARGKPYALGIHLRSILLMPLSPTGAPTRMRPQNGQQLLAELPPTAYHTVTWGRGTKGPLRMEMARVRVQVYVGRRYRGTPQGPTDEVGWLLLERRTNETKAYLLWGLARLSLRQQSQLMRARWPIEQGYQQMKEELGLDHFEGRTWTGWHHHVTMVTLAHAFLMTVRAEGTHRRPLPTLPKVRKWIRAQMEFPMVTVISDSTDTGLRKRMLDRLLALTDSQVRLQGAKWTGPSATP
ncbi:MAG: IS701 family transposase [Thermoplasmata archaeon]|nr:IS701 family transposase [Thermoplasmata archaeon]